MPVDPAPLVTTGPVVIEIAPVPATSTPFDPGPVVVVGPVTTVIVSPAPRMIVPGLYGYESAVKWLSEVRLADGLRKTLAQSNTLGEIERAAIERRVVIVEECQRRVPTAQSRECERGDVPLALGLIRGEPRGR